MIAKTNAAIAVDCDDVVCRTVRPKLTVYVCQVSSVGVYSSLYALFSADYIQLHLLKHIGLVSVLLPS